MKRRSTTSTPPSPAPLEQSSSRPTDRVSSNPFWLGCRVRLGVVARDRSAPWSAWAQQAEEPWLPGSRPWPGCPWSSTATRGAEAGRGEHASRTLLFSCHTAGLELAELAWFLGTLTALNRLFVDEIAQGKVIGRDDNHQLMYQPGGWWVLVKRVLKYEIAVGGETTVLAAEVPKLLIPRDLLHSSALAFLAVQKFALGVPSVGDVARERAVEVDRASGGMRSVSEDARVAALALPSSLAALRGPPRFGPALPLCRGLAQHKSGRQTEG